MENKASLHEARVIENVGDIHVASGVPHERPQPLNVKTVILLTTIVSAYFAQVFQIVGSGFLGRQITDTIGGRGEIVWLTSILTIEQVVFGPPVSQAADYWGRKWPVLLLTACGSVGCIVGSRANSIGMMLAAQAIAGLSQASQPLLHAMTSEIIPRKYRPVAQIFNNVAAGLGGTTGLLVGGALSLHNVEGWRTYWYIAAGIYAISFIGITLLYHPGARQLQVNLSNVGKLKRLDWVSYILLLVGLALFCVALSWSQNPYHWNNAHIVAPFVIGIVVLIGLGLYCRFIKKDGLFHHGLFSKNGNFAIAEVAIFAEGSAFFASNNYFSYQMEAVYGQNQFRAGLAFAVSFISYTFFSVCVGFYCARTKSIRFPLMAAFAFFTLYHALMAATNVNTSVNPWGYIVISGVGLSIALNVLIVVAQLSTPVDLISTASGLMISTRGLGATVGLSIYNAVFNSALTSHLGPNVYAATAPLKLPPASIGPLIAALTEGEIALAEHLPGVTPQIIEAAGLAIQKAFVLAFRNVWITAASFTAFALVCSFFIIDPREEFTASIDAPVEYIAIFHHKEMASAHQESKEGA